MLVCERAGDGGCMVTAKVERTHVQACSPLVWLVLALQRRIHIKQPSQGSLPEKAR